MFFIKPLRDNFENPCNLDRVRCIRNIANSIETSLFLDLNILSQIRKVIEEEVKYEDTFLVEFVDKVKNLSGLNIFISPGFAFLEVSNEYELRNYNAFEKFINKYLNEFRDSYDSLPYQIHNNQPDYNNLLPKTKESLSFTYASILLLHYLDLDKKLSGIEKFKKFMNILHDELDFVDGLVLMIGQYFFCARLYLNENLRIMVDNFLKIAHSQKSIRNSLNATRDIFLYRILAFIELGWNGMKVQDCWLVTADKGIKILSDYIFYMKHSSGKAAIISSYSKEVENNQYFQESQNYLKELILKRCLKSNQNDIDSKIKQHKIEIFIKEMEDNFKNFYT